MKRHAIAVTLLGNIVNTILASAEIGKIKHEDQGPETYCLTYLSTYLVPVSMRTELPRPSSNTSKSDSFPSLPSPESTFGVTTLDSPDYTAISTERSNSFSSLSTSEISVATTAIDSSVTRGTSSASFSSLSPSESSALVTTIDSSVTQETSSAPSSVSTSVVTDPPGQRVIFGIVPSAGTRKRDLGGFVGDGSPDVCTFATTFTLGEGRLFAGRQPVAYVGGDFQPLQSSSVTPGDAITTTFSNDGGILRFANPSLPGGQAGFCQTPSDGQIYLTFTSQPSGCEPVTLSIYGVERCINGRIDGLETSVTTSERARTTDQSSTGASQSTETDEGTSTRDTSRVESSISATLVSTLSIEPTKTDSSSISTSLQSTLETSKSSSSSLTSTVSIESEAQTVLPTIATTSSVGEATSTEKSSSSTDIPSSTNVPESTDTSESSSTSAASLDKTSSTTEISSSTEISSTSEISEISTSSTATLSETSTATDMSSSTQISSSAETSSSTDVSELSTTSTDTVDGTTSSTDIVEPSSTTTTNEDTTTAAETAETSLTTDTEDSSTVPTSTAEGSETSTSIDETQSSTVATSANQDTTTTEEVLETSATTDNIDTSTAPTSTAGVTTLAETSETTVPPTTTIETTADTPDTTATAVGTTTGILSRRNVARNGGFATPAPDPADGIIGFDTEGEATHRSGDCHQGAGTSDNNCVALKATEGSKRGLETFAGISQRLMSLNPSTTKLYTVQFYYATTSVGRSQTCTVGANLGDQQFYSHDLFGSGSVGKQWNRVLRTVRADSEDADLRISMACTGRGEATIYIDSIFVSNEVTPNDIDLVHLDFGDDDVHLFEHSI
ncbi:hypothetical protein FHETE_5934 [Fusarium heterosporum]|uniref:DUF7908 domain-containing protein n=1 Tax=Fusarium heterosporum TaxID=42747 RepID=A0A8H5WPB9_FUSHE|nr:hypothetical protein FHETE_5934 [Fusarium heterosporum]